MCTIPHQTTLNYGQKANNCSPAEFHILTFHWEPIQCQCIIPPKHGHQQQIEKYVISLLLFWTQHMKIVLMSWYNGMSLSSPKWCVLCPHSTSCQFLGHMLIPESIWENPSSIRHSIAQMSLGSHYFYPAADSSLHSQFPPTPNSSGRKGPELMGFLLLMKIFKVLKDN